MELNLFQKRQFRIRSNPPESREKRKNKNHQRKCGNRPHGDQMLRGPPKLTGKGLSHDFPYFYTLFLHLNSSFVRKFVTQSKLTIFEMWYRGKLYYPIRFGVFLKSDIMFYMAQNWRNLIKFGVTHQARKFLAWWIIRTPLYRGGTYKDEPENIFFAKEDG